MGKAKLNLAMVNGMRREFRQYKHKRIKGAAERLSSKYGITLEHFYKVIRKVYWKKSTIRNPQYEFFKEHQFKEGSA